MVDITEAFRVKLTFESYPTITEVLHYLPGLTVFLVLGVDILAKHPFRLDLQSKDVSLDRETAFPGPKQDSPVNR